MITQRISSIARIYTGCGQAVWERVDGYGCMHCIQHRPVSDGVFLCWFFSNCSFFKAKVMLARLFRRIWDPSRLYAGHYIEVKAFYTLEFDAPCSVSFVGDIDAEKAYAFLADNLRFCITAVYQHAWFDHERDCMLFNNTIFVLHDKRMIELGSNYCQLLHGPSDYAWANDLIRSLAAFRVVNTAPAIGFSRQASVN